MPDDFQTWFAVFLRAGALFAAFPVFSAQNFPVQLRVALAAIIAFLVSPNLPAMGAWPGMPAGWVGLVLMLGREVVLGLLLGFSARMIFFAIDFAAALIATETGLSLPTGVNPLSPGQSEALGTLLYMFTVVLFLCLDVHHGMLLAFQRSFEVIGPGAMRWGESLALDLMARTGQVFVIAIHLAAPVIAVSFVVNMMMSLLSRAAPQMNVFADGFAIRILGGLAVFGLTIHILAAHLGNHVRRIPDDLLRLARLATGGP